MAELSPILQAVEEIKASNEHRSTEEIEGHLTSYAILSMAIESAGTQAS